MHGKRTQGWYTTRILLAIGIGAVLFAGAVSLIDPTYSRAPLTMSTPRVWESPLGVVGFLGMLFGLAWMIRIFRGLREDEPPPWRYRDR